MARLGRKSKLTPARAEAIAQYISAGLLDKNAARLAGIGVRTFYYWLSKAEEENAEPKYVQFREAMELARINFEHHHLQIIAQAGHNGDWRASAFILERRFPERYGRGVEHSGDIGGGPTKVEVVFGEDRSANREQLESENETDEDRKNGADEL